LFLTERLAPLSRATVRRAIDAGDVTVDDAAGKPSLRLRAGNHVVVHRIDVPREGPAPQEIPLTILHEDESIFVVN
jgi:23S rRNA pseudouridine1911/1915/1917 synthase